MIHLTYPAPGWLGNHVVRMGAPGRESPPAGEKRLAAEAARLHSHATAALRRLNLNLAGGAA